MTLTAGPMTAGLGDPALLLEAWDVASTAPEVARGGVVLAAIGAVTADGLADLPLGVLGELALRCHLAAFGARLDGVVACPTCAGTLEVVLRLDHLLADSTVTTDTCRADAYGTDSRRVELAHGVVLVRAPTVRDLLAAGDVDDPAATILARCVRDLDGRAVDTRRLSAADLELLDTALEQGAGIGLTRLRTSCPDCDTEVVAVLDPCALLWGRVRMAAPALLHDVARLAAAFGWTEDDVLALSSTRRAAYLELVP